MRRPISTRAESAWSAADEAAPDIALDLGNWVAIDREIIGPRSNSAGCRRSISGTSRTAIASNVRPSSGDREPISTARPVFEQGVEALLLVLAQRQCRRRLRLGAVEPPRHAGADQQ